MDSIIISSVDLSPLKSLSKYIQLDFEGYFEEDGSGYPFSLLLDTETNMAVKHPDTDTQSIKFAFTKDYLTLISGLLMKKRVCIMVVKLVAPGIMRHGCTMISMRKLKI